MTVRRGGVAFALVVTVTIAAALAAVFAGRVAPEQAGAASHREAPLISLDPAADITDFYMFRSYETGKSDRVVLIMDVNPGEEPSSGPNYFGFDPNVTYSFGIDNNRDGVAEDIRFDVRFHQEIRGVVKDLGLPLSFVGGLEPDADPTIPRIDSFDSPGLGLRQTYTVTLNGHKVGDGTVVPSRVGPRTTGDDAQYDALAAQGLVTTPSGIRLWVGQRDDPFAIDLGAFFDSINLRSLGATGGVDMLSGFNVHTIAIEVPTHMITNGSQVIGAYAFTSRPETTIRTAGGSKSHGKLVQVQRLANPLINEVIIGTRDKDHWNGLEPEEESQFLGYYLKPRASLALQLATNNTIPTSCVLPAAIVPDCSPAAPTLVGPDLGAFNRTDLTALLLQYNGVLYGSGGGGAVSELLRLNVGIDAKPLDMQNRLGVLGGDLAGWPNGRRPNDDVTDAAVQAAGGQLYVANVVGDGVSANDKPLPASFPFLPSPHDGRNRFHVNP